MRIFLAGASGLIGIRLIPLMLGAGHQVAGMTRSRSKVESIRALGALPVLCDVYDADDLAAAVGEFAPDLVMHQLTDLPDDLARLPDRLPGHVRIRDEGTRNLLRAAGGVPMVAQSIAWSGGAPGERFERTVLVAAGTVIRYGQFYGPGTYYEAVPPDHPRIQIDDAARRTMDHLAGGLGIVEIVEPMD
jgi:NAD(P)-dependent dehydrogenase (short-subunit alcohol dehydrogenase family)